MSSWLWSTVMVVIWQIIWAVSFVDPRISTKKSFLLLKGNNKLK